MAPDPRAGRSPSTGSFPTLGFIPVGEPDANAESAIAQREKRAPLYLSGFVEPPLFRIQDFEAGTKFLILGQKGTGKTAILRNIQSRLERKQFRTEYIVFRDTLLEEGEIANIPFDYVVSKENMRSSTFYHHCLKRIFISTILKILSKEGEFLKIEDDKPTDKLFSRVVNLVNSFTATESGQIVSLVVDSAFQDVADARKLLGLDRAPSEADVIRLLKRLNDRIMEICIQKLKELNLRIAVFVDEVHFRYRDEASIRDDAVLVRDAILAIFAINERFIKENLNAAIFVGIRSEYLSHPVIAGSEIGTKIQSFGEKLGWETLPANASHPLFILAEQRITAGLKQLGLSDTDAEVGGTSIVRQLFQNTDRAEFIQSTWSKPRDMVRFLKNATRMFAENRSLSWEQFHAVMRAVAQESWDEVKSALSSFLSERGILELENYIKQRASISLEKGKFCDYATFEQDMQKIFLSSVDQSIGLTLTHFINLLYMLGVITTTRTVPNGRPIRHSFHRGQPSPDHNGSVAFHFLVAKCFS